LGASIERLSIRPSPERTREQIAYEFVRLRVVIDLLKLKLSAEEASLRRRARAGDSDTTPPGSPTRVTDPATTAA